MNAQKYDYAIVGQGLAGTLLAWCLRRRGKRIVFLDRDEATTASKIAAGLINPITGQRTCLSWRLHDFLPFARTFYRSVERELDASLLHSMPLTRLLSDDRNYQKWMTIANDPDIRSFLSDPQPIPLVDPAKVNTFHPTCGFEISEAHILDVPGLLRKSREVFDLRIADLDIAHAIAPAKDSVQIAAGSETITAHRLIFCQGPDGRHGNPFFDWVPFTCAKGEILTITCPAMESEERILNGGGWMAPVPGASPGVFRAGSTYVHDDLSKEPTAAGRDAIIQKLKHLLKVDFTVTAQAAGVRPIIERSRALIGMHPSHQRIGFFNGLGSKGSLNGPFIAEQFAAHLEDGAALEHDLDLLKNL